jgi:hypothetical protein
MMTLAKKELQQMQNMLEQVREVCASNSKPLNFKESPPLQTGVSLPYHLGVSALQGAKCWLASQQ